MNTSLYIVLLTVPCTILYTGKEVAGLTGLIPEEEEEKNFFQPLVHCYWKFYITMYATL